MLLKINDIKHIELDFVLMSGLCYRDGTLGARVPRGSKEIQT